MTPNYKSAHMVAKLVKEVSKETTVIMGGAHPTVLPVETLQDPNVDIVVRGEGELTAFEVTESIAGRLQLKDIAGISFKENGKIIQTPERVPIEDLDSLPLPARHLLPVEKYRPFFPDQLFKAPVEAILTSRGCPFRCIFCAARVISGRKYRWRSPKKVIEEIELLINEYGIQQLGIIDDTFTADKKRAEKICEELITRKLNKDLVWLCATRVDAVDRDLLKKMCEAGCRSISYGIESGSQRLLNLIRKGISLDQAKKAVKSTKEAGIECRGTFILGLPTETRNESMETINFAKELDLDFAKFSLATPYPGTELHDIAVSDGNLSIDWSMLSSMIGFSECDPAYVPTGRDPKELKSLQRKAMKEFYFRPKQIWGFAKNIHSLNDIKRYLWGAYGLLR